MTSDERKATPVYSGVVRYFPRALQAVAQLSKAGNDKHNPGEPLHWSRHKSNDHLDCIMRHIIDAGTVDPEDGMLHDVKIAWRALANLELALEACESIGAAGRRLADQLGLDAPVSAVVVNADDLSARDIETLGTFSNDHDAIAEALDARGGTPPEDA